MSRRLQSEKPYTPLDEGLVASVLQPQQHEQSPDANPRHLSPASVQEEPPEPNAIHERMTATLRVRLSSREKREFEAFVARLGSALDTTMKPSNVLRAVVTIVQHAEPLLIDSVRRQPRLRRPPNDDAIAYAEFEQQLVKLIDSAIRSSTAYR